MYAQQYIENDLVDRTAVELVCLLYSKAIEKTTQAVNHTRNGEVRERGACLARVMEIIAELQGSLNLEAGGQVALELARLYDYIQRQLIDAAGDAKAEGQLSEVGALLENLFAGWRDCEPDPTTSGPQKETPAERLLVFRSSLDCLSQPEAPAKPIRFADAGVPENLPASGILSPDPPHQSRVWTL